MFIGDGNIGLNSRLIRKTLNLNTIRPKRRNFQLCRWTVIDIYGVAGGLW